jgi:hypothetical protein
METWERCLWALRFEVEPAIANDVEKHVTEKIVALRERAEAAEARVTALRATLAHIARGEIVDGTERSFFSAEQMRAMALAALAGSVDAPTGGDDGDL